MDVDGTLTDGTIAYDERGTEWKSFHSRDGAGIRFLPLAGIVPAIVSGRTSPVVLRRAKELGIGHVVQGSKDKAAAVRGLAARVGVSLDEVAFIGDDLLDVPPMREAGFSAAPADAAPEARRAARFRCTRAGGRGAVREAIEACLKREGRWGTILAAFGAGNGRA
jgi:3-deoxy-D-manno-octulosonate 8-phosphate phosphatase (KDO 8-P phosphatase)